MGLQTTEVAAERMRHMTVASASYRSARIGL